jgi:transposase
VLHCGIADQKIARASRLGNPVIVSEAAKVGGVTLQIVQDWVVRFNTDGPSDLINRKAPG